MRAIQWCMTWNEVLPTTLQELLLELVRLHTAGSPVLFRGQANRYWRLTPSLDRRRAEGDLYVIRLERERAIIEQFESSARFLLGAIEEVDLFKRAPTDLMSRLKVMQHYGAPTRLLDWSHSALVAAFFAALSFPGFDGAIWWFRVEDFERAAGEQWAKLGMRKGGSEEVDFNRHAFFDDSPNFLGTLYPIYPFARAEAQRGVFTVAGRLGTPHDELLASLLPRNAYGKVLVSARLKEELLNTLRAMSITPRSLRHNGADQLGMEMRQMHSD